MAAQGEGKLEINKIKKISLSSDNSDEENIKLLADFLKELMEGNKTTLNKNSKGDEK